MADEQGGSDSLFANHNEPAPRLSLPLPLPPSVNHLYATVNGRRVLSRAGRDFKALVADEVEAWRDREGISNQRVEQFGRHYLALTVTFYFATPLRRDLDGGLKITQDALCEALGINDNLVAEIHLYKRVDRQHPRIDVQLTPTPDVVLHEGISPALKLPAFPVKGAKRQRRRRKQRSLDELMTRHNWD